MDALLPDAPPSDAEAERTWMLVQPMAGEKFGEELNLVSRVFPANRR